MLPKWYQVAQNVTKVVQDGTKHHVSRPCTVKTASPETCFWLVTENKAVSNWTGTCVCNSACAVLLVLGCDEDHTPMDMALIHHQSIYTHYCLAAEV